MYISRSGTRNFCLEGPNCSINIFIKTTPPPHTHIYTFVFLLYTHIFLFDKSYIYTQKKKGLIFSVKIMFDGNLS